MGKDDLRKNIISQKLKNKENELEDLIYIDSIEEQAKWGGNNEDKITSATDYAIMNHVIAMDYCKNKLGKSSTWTWLDSSENEQKAYALNLNGECHETYAVQNHGGICPVLYYRLPKNDKEKRELNIKNVKDQYGNSLYYTLDIGEYPKDKVNSELEEKLEKLYNNGELKNEINSTGRWYSGNGQEEVNKSYAGKHSPEFIYNNEKYVRVISNPCNENEKYSDGTKTGKVGSIKWVKVKPISFIIKNWEDLPQNINPNGTGKTTYFDLKSEEAIIGNTTLYSENGNIGWKSSIVRKFLNGSDTKDIAKCNFLNEAFNRKKRTNI